MKTLLKQISQVADELYNGNIDSANKENLLNRLEKLSVDYINLKRELHITNDHQQHLL
ncbi:hypothetical protein SPSIL_057630 [Sporomusa silvacetica DSM 10669]|uniref:Spo0E like sporulation regulatory protein n=1 Tax=Sporomusa silvacetica DSM 10669 TaxID=1123289 RepID=A0ABZ3IV08_9FIRM|nr:hypothetical protein [Sporomusa silvacetica]OZC14289.1 hypothetical protein SPSIL_50160 [Sporomusa silvacetica DSM 10669]